MPGLRERIAHPWRALADAMLFLFGLLLYALAHVLSLNSSLGAYSWTVLHDGIARQTPLSIGQATQVVGLLMLAVAWKAGIKPGPGTIANMLLLGLFVDLIIWTNTVPQPDAWHLRALTLTVGAVTLGLAAALCLKARFGVGPRDSFILAIMRRTGLRVGIVRWLTEISAVTVGALLGGRFGIGTVLFTLVAAIAVDVFFRVFRLRVGRASRAEPAPASPLA